MAVTQAQAVAYGRQIVGLAGQLAGLRNQCRAMQVQKGNNSYDTVWAAMATAPMNADGTIGAKDASPVITNPIIDPAQVGAPTFLLPSKTQLANIEGIIDAFLQFLDGTAAPPQLNRNGNIDPVVG